MVHLRARSVEYRLEETVALEWRALRHQANTRSRYRATASGWGSHGRGSACAHHCCQHEDSILSAPSAHRWPSRGRTRQVVRGRDHSRMLSFRRCRPAPRASTSCAGGSSHSRARPKSAVTSRASYGGPAASPRALSGRLFVTTCARARKLSQTAGSSAVTPIASTIAPAVVTIDEAGATE